MHFEWDPRKAALNMRKHGVTFAEAATVFGDILARVVADPDHSRTEDRFLIIGMSTRRRLLFVAFADRGQAVRLISARELTNKERDAYETE